MEENRIGRPVEYMTEALLTPKASPKSSGIASKPWTFLPPAGIFHQAFGEVVIGRRFIARAENGRVVIEEIK